MDNATQQNPGLTGAISPQVSPAQTDKKPVGLIITAVACAVVAVVGIVCGVYGLTSSDQKSQQITNLESEVKSKEAEAEKLEAEVAELKTEVASLNAKGDTIIVTPNAEAPSTEPTTTAKDGVAEVALGDKLDENAARTVYKLGECTADGGVTDAGSNLSVKCPVKADGKDALMSYNSNDSILRLTLPND